MRTMVGRNTAVVLTLASSRLLGMKTKAGMPARAAYAATALARLPVDAQAMVEKPLRRAHDTATLTTRSLKELVGFMVSFFRWRLRRPSSAPRLGACTR